MTTGALPSWSDTPTRAAIVDFMTRVSDPVSTDVVPAEERVAVFDNDDTLRPHVLCRAALEHAAAEGWTVVSMVNWRAVFAGAGE
ncbi:MAG: hypothetical protein ACRDWI_05805 [Jiangellaceae bacterium]